MCTQAARKRDNRLQNDCDCPRAWAGFTVTSVAAYSSATPAIMQCILFPACDMRLQRCDLLMPWRSFAKLHVGTPAENSGSIGKACASNASEAVSHRPWTADLKALVRSEAF